MSTTTANYSYVKPDATDAMNATSREAYNSNFDAIDAKEKEMADATTAEVTRATAAEKTLSDSISQNVVVLATNASNAGKVYVVYGGGKATLNFYSWIVTADVPVFTSLGITLVSPYLPSQPAYGTVMAGTSKPRVIGISKSGAVISPTAIAANTTLYGQIEFAI